MSEKETKLSITIKNITFDTALCEVCFHYNTQTEEISNLRLWSHFSFTSKSKLHWIDDCSYGQCYSCISRKDDIKELYKLLIDKQWVGKKLYSNERENPLTEEIKNQIQEAFKRMMEE